MHTHVRARSGLYIYKRECERCHKRVHCRYVRVQRILIMALSRGPTVLNFNDDCVIPWVVVTVEGRDV